MAELSKEQFSGKFYHGTTADIGVGNELLPSAKHGNQVWDVAKPNAAYVTTSEQDAWDWSDRAHHHGGGGTQRVYEVEPGRIEPDENLNGPQFETPSATVTRELPGPIGSQLALIPGERGRTYTQGAPGPRMHALNVMEDARRSSAKHIEKDWDVASADRDVPVESRLFDPGPRDNVHEHPTTRMLQANASHAKKSYDALSEQPVSLPPGEAEGRELRRNAFQRQAFNKGR